VHLSVVGERSHQRDEHLPERILLRRHALQAIGVRDDPFLHRLGRGHAR
jgi:hypothetical protein